MRLRIAHFVRLLLMTGALAAVRAPAHHLGNLADVEHYVRLIPRTNGIEVLFDQHFGPLAARGVMAREDRDRDGRLGDSERDAYLSGLQRSLTRLFALRVTLPGREPAVLPLRWVEDGTAPAPTCYLLGTTPMDQTLRMRWTLRADWPPDVLACRSPFSLSYRGDFGHIVMLYSVVTVDSPPAPMALLRSSAPSASAIPMPPDTKSPAASSEKLLRVMEAELVLSFVPPESSDPAGPVMRESPRLDVPGVPGPKDTSFMEARIRDRVFRLLSPPLRASTWLFCLGLCLAWGALHAMSPGHGKVIVSTYLVGMHARLRHVVLIGTVVTLTHTIVVVVLAVAAVLLKDRFAFPAWLQPLGAAAILVVGLNQIRTGLLAMSRHHGHPPESHDHGPGAAHHHLHAESHSYDHAHDHRATPGHGHDHDDPAARPNAHIHGGFFRHTHETPPGGAPRTTWELVAVGLSGGLVPCPSGIILLLFALQISQPVLGLACIVAFSLGLALTLIAIGWLALAGTHFFLRVTGGRNAHGRVTRLLPILGGCVLVALGLILLT